MSEEDSFDSESSQFVERVLVYRSFVTDHGSGDELGDVREGMGPCDILPQIMVEETILRVYSSRCTFPKHSPHYDCFLSPVYKTTMTGFRGIGIDTV